MKCRSATATLEIPIPNWNRESFTDMLIAGKTTVPWTNRELLIDDPFFYSHENDVQRAMEEQFTPEWLKREVNIRRQLAERYREEGEEDDFDEVAVAKWTFRFAMRDVRIMANSDICRCWVNILKHRPEYVDRCPWRFFQGDRIWQSMLDVELLRAINYTPLQLAEKFDLNAMTSCDWDEAIKIVPELAARRPKEHYDCYVE